MEEQKTTTMKMNPLTPSRPRCAGYILFACVLAAAVVLWFHLASAKLPVRWGMGFTLDDGWIHLAFARNVARHHVWGFNPGEPTAGVSSILWTLILACGFVVSDNGVMISCLLNFAAFVALAWLICRMVLEFTTDVAGAERGRWQTVVMLTIVIACGNLVWYAFTGMETLVILVLGAGAICASRSYRRYLTAACVLLAALVRPEGMIVGVVIALWHLRYGRPRRPGSRHLPLWAVALIAAGGGLLASGLWQYHVSGRFLPTTTLGRSWIIGWPGGVTVNPLTIVKNIAWLVGVWGWRVMQFSLGQASLTEMGVPTIFAWCLAALAAVVTAVGFVIYFIRAGTIGLMFLAWSLIQTLAYAIILPTRGHAGRYQPMVLIVALMCFALGSIWLIEAVIRSTWPRLRKLPAVTVIVLLIAATLSSTWLWRRVVCDSLIHFDRVHVATAHWLGDNTPSDATIAAFDIGAIGYLSGRRIMDLSGLIEPQLGRALYDGTMVQQLRRRRPDFLAMIFPYTDPQRYYRQLHLHELAGQGVMDLQRTFSVSIPKRYWPGEAARVLANTIRIYRLDFAK